MFSCCIGLLTLPSPLGAGLIPHPPQGALALLVERRSIRKPAEIPGALSYPGNNPTERLADMLQPLGLVRPQDLRASIPFRSRPQS